MKSACAKKRAATDSNPLRQAGILQHVLGYVGPGHWLFLSTVCSSWLEIYTSLATVTVAKVRLYGAYEESTLCVPKMTLFSSALASPSRLKLAHQYGLKLVPDHCEYAAGRHADIDTLAAAQELGMQYSNATLYGAASAVHKLAWLYAMCGPQHSSTTGAVATHAARAGSITALIWLKCTQGCVFDKYTCLAAAEGNQLPALQNLHSEGCCWDVSVLSAAAVNGAFELLRWAVEQGCPWQNFDCDRDGNFVLAADPNMSLTDILGDAAYGGNIELLEWVKQQQPQLHYDDSVMCGAARGGHVVMCEHLRSNGCEWSSGACETAASCDHVDALHWLRESGCPFDAAAVAVAAADWGTGVEVMAYLLAEGLLTGALLTEMLKYAGAMDKLAVVQWLRQQGAEWPAVLRNEELPQSWHSATLAWARAEGCTSPLE
jgi:hypothetical protein